MASLLSAQKARTAEIVPFLKRLDTARFACMSRPWLFRAASDAESAEPWSAMGMPADSGVDSDLRQLAVNL